VTVPYPDTRYLTTADGVHIGYQTFGQGGGDLVFNDGWMSNVDANWDVPEWADFQRALARRARVIMFDRRGFGVSDRPTSADALALEKSVDDLRAVLDAVGAERPTILGIEDGAAVSLMFAASFPERTRGLILVSPYVWAWRTPDFPWGETEEQAREWSARIERQWGTPEFWRWNLVEMGSEQWPEDRLRALARWSRLCASPQAALMIEEVERQVDVRPILREVHVPTMVMMAAADRELPLWSATPWVADQIPGARFVELPVDRHFILGEDESFFREVDAFLREVHDQDAAFDRVLATVLFTDIVGSTDRTVALGDAGWRELLERHHGVVRAMLARFRGTEVDTAGDGFFATFDGPARAVHAAKAIVDAMGPLGLEVRIGVHTGEVQTIDGKIGGLAVVIGSRVGGLAGPGQVLVSSTVKDLVAGSGLVFEDAGKQDLKGVPDRWHLYRLVA
jgi:pimeloyl-ACP methyl ester carboxylesterase